jgi:hypothetical protein
MKVFISWSGPLSKQYATTLREWLPCVIQSLEPFMSSEDIEKGSRWFHDISAQLETTEFGIVCVTSENFKEPWLMFEAGALAKKLDTSRVVPLLFNIPPASVTGPLTNFQMVTTPTKEEIVKLIATMNKRIEENEKRGLSEERLKSAFEVWWPKLEENFKKAGPTTLVTKTRDEKEILDEILLGVREIRNRLNPPGKTALVEALLELRGLRRSASEYPANWNMLRTFLDDSYLPPRSKLETDSDSLKGSTSDKSEGVGTLVLDDPPKKKT